MRRATGLLAAIGLVLAACGGDDSDSTAATADVPVTTAVGDDDDADGDDGSDDATTTTEASDGSASPDGVLRYGYRVEITRFDPHRATSAFDNQYLNHVYDRLVHLNQQNETVPGLADSWSFSDDGLTMTLELRDDVTFHDGTPFDAETVKANIERAKTLEDSAVASELAIVEAVNVAEDHTVEIQLNEANSAFPAILSDRPGMMISPAAFDNADLDQMPVGSGMYRVVEYQPGDRVIYERNEDYWAPEDVGLAGIEALIIPDATTRLNALRSGEIDAAEVDPSQVQEAQDAGLVVEQDLTMEFFHMQLNRTSSELGDLQVRQALNYAVDRDALVQAHGFGQGASTDQQFPPGYFAHADSIGPVLYDYDPDRARELLAEAGLADGFTFDVMVPNFPERIQLAELLQSFFADINVELTISVVEGAQLSERFYGQGLGDTILSRWTGRADPLQTLGILYTPGAIQNPGAHTTPEVQALYDEAIVETDPDARIDLIQQLTEQVTQDAMAVALYVPSYNIAMTTDVNGLVPWLSGKPEFRGVSIG